MGNVDNCGIAILAAKFGNIEGLTLHAPLLAVRCIACDGAGKTSEVIAGVDWVASNLVLPAVISMSLGADTTDAVLDAAVSAVIQMGAEVVTAAGNFNNGELRASMVPT